ncbi:hypothetical protein FRX31_010255, partial [Thalictrum thalictroides]
LLFSSSSSISDLCVSLFSSSSISRTYCSPNHGAFLRSLRTQYAGWGVDFGNINFLG